MLIRALVVWVALLVLAVLNGALREALLIPQLGALPGHQLSTLLLSILIFVAVWVSSPWLRPASTRSAWMVGAGWVCLTLAFEFLAGHYLFHNPWDKLLADYDLARGRIWPLVLLVTLLAPVVSFRLHVH